MAVMSRKLFTELEENGFDVRDDYSGRGMFGEQCFGYEPDSGNLFLWFMQQLYDEGEKWEFYDGVKALLDDDVFERECCDSLGLGSIIYFPNLKVENYPESDESEG
jgi:hypothetical protein